MSDPIKKPPKVGIQTARKGLFTDDRVRMNTQL